MTGSPSCARTLPSFYLAFLLVVLWYSSQLNSRTIQNGSPWRGPLAAFDCLLALLVQLGSGFPSFLEPFVPKHAQ